MSEKSILKSFAISVIFCAALFCSCDLFFNNKKQDKPYNDVQENNIESENNFEIQITLNPSIVEHGAIPSSSQTSNSLSSRSAAFVPTGTISNLTVTAIRKKDGAGVEIPSEDQTVAEGNKIITDEDAENKTFALKINKTGTGLIEVSFEIESTEYKGRETIILTKETSYKVGLTIFAYAIDFTLPTDGFGNVRLVTEYEDDLTTDTPSLVPQSAQMKLKKRNKTTGAEESDSCIITGGINTTARTVTFQQRISSGLYYAEIAFFSDKEKQSPLYVCNEAIVVADDKTTDTWIISSSYLKQNSEGETIVIKNEEDGPLQIVDGQVKFIITSELVKSFVQVNNTLEYYVGGDKASDYNNGTKKHPVATVQKAVDKILAVNDKTSQYTIFLLDDVMESQNTASYTAASNYSYVNITSPSGYSANQTKVKITSDPEALAEYNNGSTPKETGHGFSIDANRDASHLGSVIYLEKAELTLEKITIRGGYISAETASAAGIDIEGNYSSLTLNEGACIENNTAYFSGNYANKPFQGAAGIAIIGKYSELVMNGGEIRNNNASQDVNAGGVYVYGGNAEGGTFTMNGGSIYGNIGCKAGAIFLKQSGTFTMNGGTIGKPSSTVNQAATSSSWGNKAIKSTNNDIGGGGAIYVALGNGSAKVPKLSLNGGEISYNYSETNGGAIYCNCDISSSGSRYASEEKAIINLNGTNLLYNAAGVTSDSGSGGAIYAQCAVINMYKGTIKGNQAGGRGGAFCVENIKTDGSGSDNDNRLYIYGGRITQNLCKNDGNTSSAGMKALGGGIYLGANAKCYLERDFIIDQNKTFATNSSSSAVSYGGGIYTESLFDGTFETYTPTASARFAPHLYINGGYINANTCEAASADSPKKGSAVYTAPVLYTISNTNVISSNNDFFDSMVYVKGTTTTATLSNSYNFQTSGQTINTFSICDHEVTQAEFKAVTGGHSSNFDGTSGKEAATGEIQNNRPVEKVNWYDAIVYCNKLSLLEGLEPYYTARYNSDESEVTDSDWSSMVYSSNSTQSLWLLKDGSVGTTSSNGYRLPTSLEWEYAARDGVSLHDYYFAGTSGIAQNDLDFVAWNNDDKTHEVKKKAPNALGLYDMIGNVREWCEDDTPSPPYRNKYLHGGHYSNGISDLPIHESRSSSVLDSRSNSNTGFRVVRNAPSSSSTTAKCMVTFDTTTNWPGNTTKVSPQEVFAGGNASAPSSDPTPIISGEQKHGTFLGWYTKPKPAQNPADPSVTPITPIDSPFDFENTPITTNLTLYAVWDFVYVQGATFEGIETLCKNETNKESGVFIKDRVLPIGNLWVCDHEVTQSEYETYCKYGSTNPSTTTNGNGDNYPAYYVNWYDALVYCNLRSIAEGLNPVYKIKNSSGQLTDNPAQWVSVVSEGSGDSLRYCGPSAANDDWNNVVCDWNANGYRLPTEAEWEYFARGGNGLSGTQYIYSGSDTVGDVAWYSGNASSTTHVVKGKPANSLGLYDLSGNVWELCWDWCNINEGNVANLQATTGPYGIPSGEQRVKRGCSWNNNQLINLSINHRNANTINDRTYIDGFRLVRNAEGPAPAAPAKHTVTFDTTTTWPGSTLSIEPVQVYDGKKVAQPSETPTDTVHFRGWYTKPNPASSNDSPYSEPAFDFSTTTITQDLTLYAVWDFVYVEGFTFDGAETVCNTDENANKKSVIFIKDRVLPINNLWVCDHEVTQGEYETYCKYGGTNPDNGVGTNYPVYYVTWYDALVYCNLRSKAEHLEPVYKIKNSSDVLTDEPSQWVNRGWNNQTGADARYCGPSSGDNDWRAVVCDWNANGYRLPTEAEWEYIARGGNGLTGTQYQYSGSDTLDDVAWYNGNASGDTQVVKTKKPNVLRIYDMTGNIREWCWDWYRSKDYITDTTSQYGFSPSEVTNNYHTLRGGGCGSAANVTSLYVSGREGNTDTSRNTVFGFRVVRNAGVTPHEKYTVTFDTTTNCPGNTTKIYRQKVSAGGYAAAPSLSNPAPVDANGNRHGNFLGWYTKPNPQQNPASGSTTPIDSPFDFAHTPITGNLTLYAVWDFVYVEGGTVVGSNDYDQNSSYKGVFRSGRTVTLSSFYMSDHELTQAEYQAIMGSNPSDFNGSSGKEPASGEIQENRPVEKVSWFDAIVYCNKRSIAEGFTPCYSVTDGENTSTNPADWKNTSSTVYTPHSEQTIQGIVSCNWNANGYRLPTEAEWEYAARGGQKTYGTTVFANYFAGATTNNYNGNSNSDLNPVAWYGSNSNDKTHEVKKKASNALGLYDMSGNVFEWCWDWYNSSVGTGSVTDPCGASSGPQRVRRSGSWNEYAYFCSVSKRDDLYPYYRYNSTGFRVVRSTQ